MGLCLNFMWNFCFTFFCILVLPESGTTGTLVLKTIHLNFYKTFLNIKYAGFYLVYKYCIKYWFTIYATFQHW